MSVIDVTGKACPIPVMEAKKALAKAAEGEEVLVLVDNDIARRNVENMARGMQCRFSYEVMGEGLIQITLVAPEKQVITIGDSAELVVAIGSSTMGRGEAALGEALMKSFLYALTEAPTPPAHLLLYNSGVWLAVEGASTLKDLQTLADGGANISACGACLNYYGLTEKLAIGSVTNMFAIMTTMAQAQRLINL